MKKVTKILFIFQLTNKKNQFAKNINAQTKKNIIKFGTKSLYRLPHIPKKTENYFIKKQKIYAAFNLS